MARDLEQIVRDLQNTAIGNCRKRIEEAARRPRSPSARAQEGKDIPCCEQKTTHGVTSLLRNKYGL